MKQFYEFNYKKSEKYYIFDVKAEIADRIPHATNVSSSIIKQRHNFKIFNLKKLIN